MIGRGEFECSSHKNSCLLVFSQSAALMRTFLAPQCAPKKPTPNLEQENPNVEIINSSSEHAQQNSELVSPMPDSEEIFSRYLSNLPDDDNNKCPGGGSMSQGEEEAEEDIPKLSAQVREPPSLK